MVAEMWKTGRVTAKAALWANTTSRSNAGMVGIDNTNGHLRRQFCGHTQHIMSCIRLHDALAHVYLSDGNDWDKSGVILRGENGYGEL